MFLSIKEMKDSKLRYSLLVGIVFLIATVVFFLAGLANGLAEGFKQTIVSWDANEMVMNKDANDVIDASRLTMKDVNDVKAEKKAPVSMGNGVMTKNKKQKENIALFGIETDTFLKPKLVSGKMFKEDNEVVIGEKLAKELHVKIGDQVSINDQKDKLTVTGFINDLTHNMAPVAYTSIPTVAKVKFGMTPKNKEDWMINAIILRTKDDQSAKLSNSHLKLYSEKEFINCLPGYSAQSLTLNTMVYVLIAIAAVVIGIFMYVLTMQKRQLFGILKAQGISTATIAKSVISQSFLIAIVGTILSFLVTYGISFILPEALPFSVNILEWLLYGALLTAIATLGGIFCVSSISKIDPIIAIGG